MGQQQTEVSFSLGTKLLISVVSLLFIAIVFLDVATIFVLTEDKRAYTYQAQSTDALLAGRDLAGSARLALDTLRLSLVSADPTKAITPVHVAALQSVLDNQSETLFSSIKLMKPSTGEIRQLARAKKAEKM